MALTDFNPLATAARTFGLGPFGLFLILQDGEPDPGELEQVADSAFAAGTRVRDFGVARGSSGMLLLCESSKEEIPGLAQHLWLGLSNSRWTRVAAVLLDGNEDQRALCWERLLDCDELLRHPLNETTWGVLEPRSQVVRAPSETRPLRKTATIAKSLLGEGRPADAGFVLFEGFQSSERRVAWLRALAEECRRISPRQELDLLISVTSDPARWSEAHGVFQTLRSLLLNSEGVDPLESVLHIAELLAKATYNESFSPAPFDRDSGWWIVPVVTQVAQRLASASEEALLEALFGLN
jgi:hypothetical protein